MSTQEVNTFLSWTPPGKSVVIRLDTSAIESINIEVMRGFGVTRRRGTETGGLLIGRIDHGVTPPVVHIQDIEVCPCEYASGPSYTLSANDRKVFKEKVAARKPSLERDLYVVGYFRSHTRDGFTLDDNDASLFEEFFQDPLAMALLIKPYATRTADAAVFLQENGRLVPGRSAIEFPFLAPQVTPADAPNVSPEVASPQQRPQPDSAVAELPIEKGRLAPIPAPPRPKTPDAPAASADARPAEMRHFTPLDRPMFQTPPSESSTLMRGVSWAAFVLTLLAFGGVCGYEYASAKMGLDAALLKSGQPAVSADLLTVRLQVAPVENSLMVKWDRESAPIQAALHAMLTVTEGAESKEVRLGFAELRNGTAMYPHIGTDVRFRLELFFKDKRSFTESIEFRSAVLN